MRPNFVPHKRAEKKTQIWLGRRNSDTHGHAGYLAYDVCLAWIRKHPSMDIRQRMRNQQEFAVNQVAPSASVLPPEIKEIHRPLIFVADVELLQLGDPRIDCDERTRCDQRIERVVLQSYITIAVVAQIEVPKQLGRNIRPRAEHLWQ